MIFPSVLEPVLQFPSAKGKHGHIQPVATTGLSAARTLPDPSSQPWPVSSALVQPWPSAALEVWGGCAGLDGRSAQSQLPGGGGAPCQVRLKCARVRSCGAAAGKYRSWGGEGLDWGSSAGSFQPLWLCGFLTQQRSDTPTDTSPCLWK